MLPQTAPTSWQRLGEQPSTPPSPPTVYVPKQAMASLSDEAAQTALQSAATRQPEEVHAVMERGNVSQLQDTDAQPPELHEVPLATYPKRAHPLFAPSPASAMPPSPLQAA